MAIPLQLLPNVFNAAQKAVGQLSQPVYQVGKTAQQFFNPGGNAPQRFGPVNPPTDQGDYLEQVPSMNIPELDLSPYIEQQQREMELAQAGYSENIAEIGSQTEKQKGLIEANKQSALGDLASSQEQSQNTAERAINEARRAQAELSQGLSARYGTGVSTGLGAQAILGAQTVKNIGETRQSLAARLGEIQKRKEQVTNEANRLVLDADQQAEVLKQRASVALKEGLAAASRYRLEGTRARQDLINSYMSQYRDIVAGVNARNAAFKQAIAKQLMANEISLNKYYQTTATARDTVDLNDRFALYKAGKLSAPAVDQLEQDAQLPSGSLIRSTEIDENDPFAGLKKISQVGIGNLA
ncbi:hypothetical protein HYW46_03030 [Candidatus Daviesbacteria bacterium]|nr:hypothetical protein [Candidatus Daviesbacteria bacterium]